MMLEVIHVDTWSYGEETVWAGTLAIAETLNTYLEKYIIQQYGYDKNAVIAKDVKQLQQEIAVVVNHIKGMMEQL